MTCPPHDAHHWRRLRGVLAWVRNSSAPRVTLTARLGHSVNALTGPADHSRHELQWQYPIASGSPSTRTSTAPQKQRPTNSFAFIVFSSLLRLDVTMKS